MGLIPATTTTTTTDTQEDSVTANPLVECLAYTRYIPFIIIVLSALYGCVYMFKGVQMQLHRREKLAMLSSGPDRFGRSWNAATMSFQNQQRLPHAPPPSLLAPNEEDDHHQTQPQSTGTTVWVDDDTAGQKNRLSSWWRWICERGMRQRQSSVSSGFREYPHGRHMQDLVNQRLQEIVKVEHT